MSSPGVRNGKARLCDPNPPGRPEESDQEPDVGSPSVSWALPWFSNSCGSLLFSTLPTKDTKPDPEEDAEKPEVPSDSKGKRPQDPEARPGVAKAKSCGEEANKQKVPAVARGPIGFCDGARLSSRDNERDVAITDAGQRLPARHPREEQLRCTY